MKIDKKKLLLLICFFLALILVLAIYFFQKDTFNKDGSAMILPEQINSEKEDLDVEIINEERNLINNNENKEVAEEMLENDAEKLSVNEEFETINSGEEDKNKMKFSALPSPLKRKNTPDTLRIGLMTDLHVKSVDGSGKYLDDFYAKKMNYFVEKMNNVFSPNFILLNGDIIEGTRTSSEIGSKELSMIRNIFDRTTIKKYWVAGNHDLRSVNKDQWMKVFNIDYMSKAVTVGDYKIIILDGNFTREDLDVGPGIDYTRGKISQGQMEWLKNELEKSNKKAVVFIHYPPLRDIDAKINSALLYNARELQAIFSQYDVLAVFSGHIEDLYYQEIGGVNYFVSPGMVKYPKYLGAFSEITIKDDKINIVLNYLMENGKYRSVEIKKE